MSAAGSRALKRGSAGHATVSPPPVKRRQQSTTTQKAVANFFTPASQKEPGKMAWRTVRDSLVVGTYQATEASRPHRTPQRIAAFDFDATLVRPASGNRFGKDAYDWMWWHGAVPGRLRRLYEEGYLVTILSNQGGLRPTPSPKTVKSDQKRLADFKARVAAVLTQLDLPVSLYAACEADGYRKPRTGMWRELLEDGDLEAAGAVDLPGSVFVGDAGGRLGAKGGAAKDFACSDRNFASNVGIPFKTPEEFFLDEEARPFAREFDPALYLQPAAATLTDVYSRTNDVDIVLFCGCPGAGKSTFYWNYLKPLGYERVNQDTLKTRDKCLQAAGDFIKSGVPVVVDNTNADPDTRAHWVKLARTSKKPIRCVLFTASPQLAEHNDAVRALGGSAKTNPETRAMLPKLAFAGFASRYREPRLEEGFHDITKVEFKFEGTDEERAKWSKFWI